MEKPYSTWICCQLGARQHYAIPRALLRVGRLERLITDAWVTPTSNWRLLPGRQLVTRARQRWNTDLQNATVDSFNASFMWFEFRHRLDLSEWGRIMARNQWYGKRAVRCLQKIAPEPANAQPRTVFTYSYAALEILRYAKKRGWGTVMEQIDPGPLEANIVRLEAVRYFRLRDQWESPPSEYWLRWREECELADIIVVNSQWSFDALRAVGISDVKLRVIPLGFASSRDGQSQLKTYPSRFTTERPLRVLFLGQINLRKGVSRLLEAMLRLRGEPIEFWMVGPNQVCNLASAAEDALVRWFPATPRGATTEFYRTADVFILPTLSDGFALTQLEALAEKMPIIVSKNCGEVVRDSVDGILLQEPTADAIIEALQKCLRDPQMLADFSKEAHVRTQFSLDAIGANLAEVPGL